MKTLLPSVLLVFVVAFLFGCGTTTPPDIAAKNFYNALARKDFEAAKKFASKASLEAIAATQAAATMEGVLGVIGKKNTQKNAMPAEASEIKCTEPAAGKSECTVCCDAEKRQKKFKMIKENGEWVVDYKIN